MIYPYVDDDLSVDHLCSFCKKCIPLSERQSRLGDKPLKFQLLIVCPPKAGLTAVRKGLYRISTEWGNWGNYREKLCTW